MSAVRITISVEMTDFSDASEYITSVLVGGEPINFDSLTYGGSDDLCGTYVTIADGVALPASVAGR
eukprot:589468-Rhodomonas_salina.1